MIDKAILRLRPGAQWSLNGDHYNGLIWHDKEQTKPTKEEIEEEIIKLRAELTANAYKEKRAKEYPPIQDYLDGVVKGDQQQIKAYIDACLAVKEKYPK